MPVAQDLSVVLTEMGCGSDRRVVVATGTVMPNDFPWPDYEDVAFPFLATIDPYGDTYFSQLQMKPVIAELRALESRCRDDDDRSHLASVLDLAAKCKDGQGHEFLTFHGD